MLNILRHGEKTEYRGPLVLMAVLCLRNTTSNRLHLEAQNERGGASALKTRLQHPCIGSRMSAKCDVSDLLHGADSSFPLCVYPHSRMNHNPIKRRRGQGRKGIKNNPIKWWLARVKWNATGRWHDCFLHGEILVPMCEDYSRCD